MVWKKDARTYDQCGNYFSHVPSLGIDELG